MRTAPLWRNGRRTPVAALGKPSASLASDDARQRHIPVAPACPSCRLAAGAPRARARRSRPARRELNRLCAAEPATGDARRTAPPTDDARTARQLRCARARARARWARREGDGGAAPVHAVAAPPLFLTPQRNGEWWSDAAAAAQARASLPRLRAMQQMFSGHGLRSIRWAIGKLNGYTGGRRYDARGRCSTSCWRSPPSAPAGWRGSTIPVRRPGPALGQRARAGDRAAGDGALGHAAEPPGRGVPDRRARLGDVRAAPPPGVRSPFGRPTLPSTRSPDLRVLNGFIQSLVGLYDFAEPDRRPARARCSTGRPRGARRGADVRHRRAGRCTRAARSPASPTSATTSSCATSWRAVLAHRGRRVLQRGAHFTTYLTTPPTARACARCAANRAGSCASSCRRSRACRCACRGTSVQASTTPAAPPGRKPRWTAAAARRAITRSRVTATDLAGNVATPRAVEVRREEARPEDSKPMGRGHPLYGQGRRRQDVGRRRDRRAAARRPAAHARDLHRSRALARRRARGRVGGEPTKSAAACGRSRSRPRTSSSSTGARCRTGSAGC